MNTLLGTNFFPAGVECWVHRCSEGGPDAKRHAHDFLEIAYVQKGCGTHHLVGNAYAIRAGDVFVVNSHQPHWYTGAENLVIWYLIMGAGLLRDSLEGLKDIPGFREFVAVEPIFREETEFSQHLHVARDTARDIERLLQGMETELTRRHPGYPLVVKALAVEFLVTVSRLYQGLSLDYRHAEETDPRKTAVDQVIAFIESNHAGDVRLDDLARCGCLQSQYLCRVFKEATGMTMIEYLTHLRIQKATELLSRTNRSVTETATLSGFNDLSHFNRCFRRIAGLTPTQFRRKSRSSK